MKTPIVGGQYVTALVDAADNRMINMYAEKVPEGGKTAGFISRCPSLHLEITVGDGPIRGMIVLDREFAIVVSGKEVYYMSNSSSSLGKSHYTAALIGTVTGEGPVSIARSGGQVFIACNPDAFIVTLFGNQVQAFTKVTDPDFPGAATVVYIDGFFLFNEPHSQRLWVTELLNGFNIDALDFASAEGHPDFVMAVDTNRTEVWAFGNGSIEVFYNSGIGGFPFVRVEGALIEQGCDAYASIVKMDNAFFWAGRDDTGTYMIFRSNGYSVARISDHAIEALIQEFLDIRLAEAFGYQYHGHSFYIISFPTTQRTFVYDVATSLWYEWADYSNAGGFTRFRGNCSMGFENVRLIGDYKNGNIYSLNPGVYKEGDRPQKWLRSWRALPAGENTLKRLIHHHLQLDCQTSVGNLTEDGANPQVALRWSDDGGHTWSNSHLAPLGALGDTSKRVIWRRLGVSRDRIYELSGTDPVPVTILGAELQLSEGAT